MATSLLSGSAFGVGLQSEFPLGPRSLADESGQSPVLVRAAAVPEVLPTPRFRGPFCEGDDERFRFTVPGVGRFLVLGDHEILVDAPSPWSPQTQEAILGSGLLAVLLRRGYVVFRGSSISLEGETMTFLGHAGAGTSVLAWSAIAQGGRLVSDRMTAISPDGLLTPGPPIVRLRKDARSHLAGRDAGNDAVSVTASDAPERLGRVFVVTPRPSGATPALEPIMGARSFSAVASHLYLPTVARVLGLEGSVLQRCLFAAQDAEVANVLVPHDWAALPGVMDRLLDKVTR